MTHWLSLVVTLLESNSSDLRELARIAGGNPKDFYLGTDLSGVDVRGHDLRGVSLTAKQSATLIFDSSTIFDVGLAEAADELLEMETPQPDKKLEKLRKALADAERQQRLGVDQKFPTVWASVKRKIGTLYFEIGSSKKDASHIASSIEYFVDSLGYEDDLYTEVQTRYKIAKSFMTAGDLFDDVEGMANAEGLLNYILEQTKILGIKDTERESRRLLAHTTMRLGLLTGDENRERHGILLYRQATNESYYKSLPVTLANVLSKFAYDIFHSGIGSRNLAYIFEAISIYEYAQRLRIEFLKQDALGPNWTNTQISLSRALHFMGKHYEAIGEVGQSRDYFQRAIAVARIARDLGHPHTVRAYQSELDVMFNEASRIGLAGAI